MSDIGASLDALWRERFRDLPLDCGNDANPGVQETEAWREWYNQDTTPDQERIEEYLDKLDLAGLTVLHIGIGNSKFALRFSPRVKTIIGTTISDWEARRGRELDLPNYSPIVHNKYLEQSPPEFRHFDIVIDNNPTTFACCRRHLACMMSNLAVSIVPDGVHVTDRQGLGWVVSAPDANPRWSFDFDDWAALGAAFGLPAARLTDDIYALGSCAHLRPHRRRSVPRRILNRLARLFRG
jgi:hypothetical protein